MSILRFLFVFPLSIQLMSGLIEFIFQIEFGDLFYIKYLLVFVSFFLSISISFLIMYLNFDKLRFHFKNTLQIGYPQ